MRITTKILIFMLYVISTAANAITSKEYAILGKATWSSFECSSLASEMKNVKEQTRLFEAGYTNGLTFIGALKTGKINNNDLSNEVPIVVISLLQGPTPDFILGRIYENAQDAALKGIDGNDKKFNEILVENKFDKLNCRLIGIKL